MILTYTRRKGGTGRQSKRWVTPPHCSDTQSIFIIFCTSAGERQPHSVVVKGLVMCAQYQSIHSHQRGGDRLIYEGTEGIEERMNRRKYNIHLSAVGGHRWPRNRKAWDLTPLFVVSHVHLSDRSECKQSGKVVSQH